MAELEQSDHIDNTSHRGFLIFVIVLIVAVGMISFIFLHKALKNQNPFSIFHPATPSPTNLPPLPHSIDHTERSNGGPIKP